MLRILFSVIAVLLFNACAPKLMPHQVVAQPSSYNEVVKAKFDSKDVYLMVARIGGGDNSAIVISGPFAVGELDNAVDSGTWEEKFENIRQERAWLLFEFLCGGKKCKANFHERRTGGQLVADNWWFRRYHPKLLKKDIPGWVSENLTKVGLKTDWKY